MNYTFKVNQNVYDYIVSGKKTFDIRKNDRDYKVGDLIKFVDLNGKDFENYAYRIYEITYISKSKDYVVFSIKENKND